MSRDDKIRMPSSQAGITQFYDEAKSKIVLKPVHVIILIVLVIIIEIFLYVQGRALLGLG